MLCMNVFSLAGRMTCVPRIHIHIHISKIERLTRNYSIRSIKINVSAVLLWRWWLLLLSLSLWWLLCSTAFSARCDWHDAKCKARNISFIFLFSIRRHPLFSLLALMLEKCEQATQGYIPKSSSSTTSSSSPNGTNGSGGGGGDSDSFTKDIQAFVQMLEKENRPLLTQDAELDGLVSYRIVPQI